MKEAVSAETKSIFDSKLHRKYPGLKEIENQLEPKAKYTFCKVSFNEALKVVNKDNFGLRKLIIDTVPGLFIIQYTHDFIVNKHSWIIVLAYEFNGETNIREVNKPDEKIFKLWYTSDNNIFVYMMEETFSDFFQDFSFSKKVFKDCILDMYENKGFSYDISTSVAKLNQIANDISIRLFYDDFEFRFFITPNEYKNIWVEAKRKIHIGD